MKIPLLFSLCCLPIWMLAQNKNAENFTLKIQKASEPLKIDGLLEEAIWQNAPIATDFTRNFPVDTGLSINRTEVQVAFDHHFFYFAAKCFQKRSEYTVQSLKRDFGGGTSDVLNLVLDPTKDGLNGFLFAVSPLGVQREALVSFGENLEFDWDNRWYSAVQNFDEYWTIEMAIPFKTLRYNVSNNDNTWHINFVRTRLNSWEVSTWAPVPQQFSAQNLAFCGTLQWEQAPPKPSLNYAIIPYLRTGFDVKYNREPPNQQITNTRTNTNTAVGGDAKIAITPGLNLDLTFNPDFSQVEVDRQVANLSRFELFFPERRQFFLENRDLFATFGFPSTRPFFSRRIGLAYDPVTGSNQPVQILAGARLSGKLTDKLRVGLLNMQTQKRIWGENAAMPAANFTVATLQRKTFERSAFSAILVNKQNFTGGLSDAQKGNWQPWNRVAGLEYNLYSKDNRWEGEWYYHRSFSPDKNREGHSFANFLAYRVRTWNVNFGYVQVDKKYDSEAGFVPRRDYQAMFPGANYIFYFKNKKVNTLRVGVSGDLTYNLAGKNTDRAINSSLQVQLKDQTRLNVESYQNYTFLLFDFDPTNLYQSGTEPLKAGTDYHYNGINFNFSSSSSYNFQAQLQMSLGEYFNGNITSVNGFLSYRWQPIGLFTLAMNYNRIRLPKPNASADVLLISPRMELSFSKSVFASAFFQYNTQANNFNINTRLQWRFAPVSDLFLVYTDNSFAEAIPNSEVRFLSPKNRALILKVAYWLNK